MAAVIDKLCRWRQLTLVGAVQVKDNFNKSETRIRSSV